MSKEYIRGFSIEKRELTEEEATRPLTLKRFQEFHYEAGEDFVDYAYVGSSLRFITFLKDKYPEQVDEILDINNRCVKSWKHLASVQDYQSEFYNDSESQEASDKFYTDYAEFINQNDGDKKEANQVIIQLIEHYNK